MSALAKLSRYRSLLQEKADLQKRDLDLAVEIQVCEKELELEALMVSAGVSVSEHETKDFIEEHRTQLEAYDIEFMEIEYRGTREVADHTGISISNLKRLADRGQIECKKTDRGHRRFKTLSIVQYLINAKTEEET